MPNIRRRIGIVGFGEVGRALRADAVAREQPVICYDPRGRRAGRDDIDDAEWASTVEDFADAVGVVVVAVPGDQAIAVADAVVPHLRAGTVYSDWTTKSPPDRDRVAELAAAASLPFVDVAIVDTVTWSDRQVEVLASGPGATALAPYFAGSRMQVNVVDPSEPVSCEVKLCRTVLLKGLAALLIESLVVAERLDITDVVVAGVDRFMSEDFARIRQLALTTLPDHVERRSSEMRAAAEFVRDHLGAAPMASASAAVFGAARDALARNAPAERDWRATIEALERAAVFGSPTSGHRAEVLP